MQCLDAFTDMRRAASDTRFDTSGRSTVDKQQKKLPKVMEKMFFACRVALQSPRKYSSPAASAGKVKQPCVSVEAVVKNGGT